MEPSIEILNELKAISSTLSGIGKTNVFAVPDGYFSVLALDVFKKINSSNEQLKAADLSVPHGYFENLSASVLSKIKSLEEDPAQELRSLSPMLYSIQNEKVFDLPANYFLDLEDDILNKINSKPLAKIVNLKRRNNVFTYAAAAVLTGLIGISSLLIFNKSTQSNNNVDQTVSGNPTASVYKNEQQLNAAIATLADDEIIKYLERSGNDVDNEALVIGIDESQLPTPNDYMLNENTLDTYLNVKSNSQN